MTNFNFMAKPKVSNEAPLGIPIRNLSSADDLINTSTLTSTMNNQSPSMVDLSFSSKNIKLQEKKADKPVSESNSLQSVFTQNIFGRKKKNNSIEVQASSPVNQTPAEIVSDVVQKPYNPSSNSSGALIQCQIKINDETQQYLESPFARQVNLAPNELEELLIFVEGVEYRRKQQEKEQQERRSGEIARKISSQKNGKEFLESNNIYCNAAEQNAEGNSISRWVQSITIVKSEQDVEEVSQALNFFSPQHSWILESWLSQQAVSWTVRRYNQNNDQIVYQVSFGFPDQTFLDAEGPSREGAIMAVAEDLMD